jgi:hypothetical protein
MTLSKPRPGKFPTGRRPRSQPRPPAPPIRPSRTAAPAPRWLRRSRVRTRPVRSVCRRVGEARRRPTRSAIPLVAASVRFYGVIDPWLEEAVELFLRREGCRAGRARLGPRGARPGGSASRRGHRTRNVGELTPRAHDARTWAAGDPRTFMPNASPRQHAAAGLDGRNGRGAKGEH